MKYLVVKERESEFPNPIKLVKGEKVECLKESNEDGEWGGWVYCKSSTNEGWVPKQIISRSHMAGKVIEDYDATEFDLAENEVIIGEKVLNGWVWGCKEKDPENRAWVPLNHIKIIDDISLSVEKLWKEYSKENPEVNSKTPYQSWHFCYTKEPANRLLELVLRGIKTGTTSLDSAWEPHEEKPKPGNYSVITDFSGRAKCIIKTTEVIRLPFSQVTEEMAFLEGEGDRTLEYWRKGHREFFETYCKSVNKNFSKGDLVIFEKFKVVYKLTS